MIRIFLLWLVALPCMAQTYELRKEHDSLYWLNEWRLPYPVYQFQTGDVNGDGKLSILDVTALIEYLLTGEDEGLNLYAADVNDSGDVSIADLTVIISLLLDSAD